MTRAAFGAIAMLAACVHGSGAADTCQMFPTARAASNALAELGDAKPYRNYVAVTHVGELAHHFTVYYDDIEPALERVRARFDAAGHVVIEPEGGWGGGLAVHDRAVPAPPPDIAPLARAVEHELASRCGSVHDLRVAYLGEYRIVDVDEFIAHDLRSGTRRGGWKGTVEMHADAALSKIVGVGDQMSGYGTIEVPATAHWVELDPVDAAWRGLVPATGRAAPRVLAAARALAANEPAVALASLPVPDPDALLPHGYSARVVLKLTLRAHAAFRGGKLAIPLDVHDAVFARATGDASTTIGDVHFKIRATLVPDAPREATPAREETRYRGTLTVHVEDDRGHAFDRSYPASGALDVEGELAVAPSGFDLPGASSPSKEHDLLHAALPGDIDLDVSIDLFDDPRKIDKVDDSD